MIYGIGVDTASAARLAKSAQRDGFLAKVFGAQEQVLFATRAPQQAAQSMAANFAAKEAFGKALGVGIFSGAFALAQVQALRDESGAPYLALSGKAAQLMHKKNLTAYVSLTHEDGTATAFVVLETCPPTNLKTGGHAERKQAMITPADVKGNEQIRTYIEKADETLMALGYTEHSYAHVTRVAHFAEKVLSDLGHDKRTCELAWIAGYIHDIGNVINRIDHAQSGAVMAFRILDKMGMEAAEIATVCSAIGNHDENTAFPVNAVAAALILADKTDVRRTRVRNTAQLTFDIHDRVNYAVEKASTTLSEDKKAVVLALVIDSSISPVMDYFEIFLERMLLCRKAAEKLGLAFRLVVNGQAVL